MLIFCFHFVGQSFLMFTSLVRKNLYPNYQVIVPYNRLSKNHTLLGKNILTIFSQCLLLIPTVKH